ncbi:hypothetical protein LB519_20120 [Mesorhizobium sp. AD1-1]|uniref:DUF6804 family protein n=1 Tax=Mesorhizobium sp. AD1-1 TaxID=2876621 RepID=UPI001CC9FA91|nr:DUF6804 family protein [Mesorhizobium sp. AD1-1]MBZ9720155.1 hypothetical protein [Mesorhizobium sp. AD1-1]
MPTVAIRIIRLANITATDVLKSWLSTPGGTVRLVCICVTVMSLLAVAPWPYGYYQLLRVIVCAAGIYCGAVVWKSALENHNLAWALFGAAAIFNPFLPVHLPRELWAVFNVGAAALFGFVAHRQR